MSFSVESVSLQIKNKQLLEDISFVVNPGELVALLGPNGAGKSSLLKTMTAEYRFSAGHIQLNGQSYSDWKPRDIARIVGVLPQHSELTFPFNVMDVVMLGRLPHESGRVADAEIAFEALSKVDMQHMAGSLYPSLSGGEKQRVQLARVLAQIWDDEGLGDRYLLLDEPTSALDLSHQHQILQSAKELCDKGIGVMAILHDLNLAARYADRIIILQQGRIAKEGRVQDVLQAELISSVFGIEVSIIPHPSQDRPLVITG